MNNSKALVRFGLSYCTCVKTEWLCGIPVEWERTASIKTKIKNDGRGKGENSEGNDLVKPGGMLKREWCTAQGRKGQRKDRQWSESEPGRSEASGGTSLQLSLRRQPFLFNSELFAGDMGDVQGSVWALLAAFCLCRCKSREIDLRSLSSVLFLSHNESSAEIYWYLM